jgi:AcrR family transcriptional regulator
MTTEPGLRERKKHRTRRHISDTASLLFLQRGFDAVTVAEVARAADVSTKTVFNYFARKEDLFLDRFEELTALVERAVRGRPPGQPVVRALRDLHLRLLADQHPISGYVRADYAHFWRVVQGSPALQARTREFLEELEDLVARLLAEAEGGDPDDVRVRFAAAVMVAAYRTVFAGSARRILAGEDAAGIVEGLPGAFAQTYDAAERALAGL